MSRIGPRSNDERPKFCKVIIDPEADDLAIPEEFVRRHGRDLPRSAVLKVPSSCKLWEVEVFKSDDGEIFLKNGWKDFKEYFSVKLGGFMVFMFSGGSVFDVFIYDMTCTSIDYPSSDDDSDEETVSESNGNRVLLGESSELQKGKEKVDDTNGSIARGKNHGCSSSKRVLKKQRGIAYKKAAEFMATIPEAITSFIIVMGRSNTSDQTCLTIPVSIAKDVLSKRFGKVGKVKSSKVKLSRNVLSKRFRDIKLQVVGGGIYFLRCSLKGDTKARITSGWKDVVLDNKLKPGDCCVMQVSRDDELEWYVTIFRK